MSQQPKTIQPETLAVEAMQIFQQHKIQQLLVVEKEALKGIIHIQDLLKEGIV